MYKIMTIVGTRPELIKLSMVLFELDRSVNHVLVHTGQNYDYELNQIFFDDLKIRKPDYFLKAVENNAAKTIGRIIEKCDDVLDKEKPDAVLVYGDTNSCLGVIAAKRRQIPIFHMEAGNRCFDLRVPEEINRKIIDHISDINMTITEHARQYLISEGIRPETIMKIGSSMQEIFSHFQNEINSSKILGDLNLKSKNYFVVSAHREENIDDKENFKNLIDTLNYLSTEFKLPIIFSVHPRTKLKISQQNIVFEPEIQLSKPLGFFDYINLQKNALCVISDSGTITEESSLLGFPAITIRNAHERPEGMDVGTLIMSGLKGQNVIESIKLMIDQFQRGYIPNIVNDYNNLSISKTVVRIIISYIDYVNRNNWRKN